MISSEVRAMLLKLKEYFQREKDADAPIIPFQKVNERLAAATGVSLRIIARITNEGRMTEASTSKKVTRRKKQRKKETQMDYRDTEAYLEETIIMQWSSDLEENIVNEDDNDIVPFLDTQIKKK